jgi:hypothetical protein
MSPALEALLTSIIDYAGMFPPAALPCGPAVENYQQYLTSPHAWMLRWFVVNAADVEKVPADLHSKLSILSEIDDLRVAAVESKKPVRAHCPVYAEVPVSQLDEAKQAGCFAKLRTGSIKPEGIPSVEDVAAFIIACAERKLAFKATAGLHHPIRAVYPLTYDANAPQAMMHGFLNVFLAAAFAWQGDRDLVPVLNESEMTNFQFADQLRWRDRSLSVEQIRASRADFAHAFGSCSFEEPVRDLQLGGLL